MNSVFNAYIADLGRLGVLPNFFVSADYFTAAGAVAELINDAWYIWNGYGDGLLLPIVRRDHSMRKSPAQWMEGIAEIWSTFPVPHQCVVMPDFGELSFLDHNFIYDPRSFVEMKGGVWSTFRKNSRKPEKMGVTDVPFSVLDRHTRATARDRMLRLLSKWADGRGCVHDPDIMIWFIQNAEGVQLFQLQGKIVAFNIYDYNHSYVNFRYCITDPEIPFLSEFARREFYRAIDDKKLGRLVNDGGSLGYEGLYKFKQKLNPVQVYESNTWRIG